jgi:hypothetical protein
VPVVSFWIISLNGIELKEASEQKIEITTPRKEGFMSVTNTNPCIIEVYVVEKPFV